MCARSKNAPPLSIVEIVVFALLGAMMFCSKLLMEVAPNVHLLGAFVMTFTVVFRKKALIPLYVYVFLNGLYAGFDIWWLPYLYIWTILWGVTMLLPKSMPSGVACVVYPLICGLHGLAFGILYAPAQALLFGFDLNQTLAWIAVGFPWDVVHGVSNVFAGLLIVPLSTLLRTLLQKLHRL